MWIGARVQAARVILRLEFLWLRELEYLWLQYLAEDATMPRGRPKSAETREFTLRVRLTPEEYRYLQSLSLKLGKSMSEVVRSRALAGMPSDLPLPKKVGA